MANKEKKGAKFGRHARNPSSKMYVLAKRWLTNKKKKELRHHREQDKHAAKLLFKKENPTKKWGDLNETRKNWYRAQVGAPPMQSA